MLNYIINRNGWYHFRRRIPSYVSHIDDRKELKISLKTKDKRQAIAKAQVYNDHIESYWKSLIQAGSTQNDLSKYRAVVQLAKAYGFAYKSSYELAEGPIEEIINRLSNAHQSKQHAEALLGGVDKPELSISDCDVLYWDLTIDRVIGKTDHQISKWQNPRRAALKNFINVIGDKPIAQVNRSDVIAFKDWWRGQIALGKSPATGNKQLQQVKDIIRTVALENEIDMDIEALFAKISFTYTVKSRPPFEADFVQQKLLPGLNALNDRDKYALWAMADTGARETEIFGLTSDDIRLNEEIPFIWIRAREGYSLKTPTSERKIPLVGVALKAFKKFPDGFEHKGNPDVFSAIVNKYLTKMNLRPTPQHSAYSLRHTFKDRLRDIEAPEEMIDSLMGHKKKGPQYGRGHKLETKMRILKKIAYSIPD